MGFSDEIAAAAARLVVDEGLEYGAAKRRAVRDLARHGGRHSGRRGELPSNVYLSGPAPHTWLLPQMAATVHHGGAGTTAAALRAGVPSQVVPFFGDQPYWGARVQATGR